MADVTNIGNRTAPSSDSPFAITVGEVYDGPLDLLLDLIRKQDINIYDIPIAQISALCECVYCNSDLNRIGRSSSSSRRRM